MVARKSWDEFRNTGLLLIINQILHIFGWAIVFEFADDYIKETDTGTILSVYPARVKYRGFDSNSITNSYLKLSKYMDENHDLLLKEASE